MKRLLVTTAALVAFAAATPGEAEETLRVGLYGIPKALGNPHASTSISEQFTWSAIFDTLTTVDGEGNVEPALAVSWRSEDPLTWVFDLRPDVRFSNGAAFDAEAVVTTVQYLTSEAAATESVARELGVLASATARGPLTVEIRTDAPAAILPAMLAGMRIPEPGQWRRLGPKGFAREPVGTGPFRVERWTTARVDLVAFEDSWRAPQVDRLELYEILEPSARVQGVQSGRLDISVQVSPDDIRPLRQSGADVHVSAGKGVTGLSFITVKDSPLADRRVRLALNHAVPREPMIEVLLAGATAPASQPAPSGGRGHDPTIPQYAYDPALARALIADAGYPDGFGFVAEIVTSGSTNGAQIYQFVAQELAKIGVDMEIQPLPIAQLINKAVTGEWDGEAFGMEYDLKPTLDLMRAIPMHSCQRAVPWHCDPSAMPIIEAAQTEFDPAVRLELLKDVSRIYHDDPPMLFLYESVHFDALGPRVRGYDPVNRVINYHEISLE